jgi:hypothetical protein
MGNNNKTIEILIEKKNFDISAADIKFTYIVKE